MMKSGCGVGDIVGVVSDTEGYADGDDGGEIDGVMKQVKVLVTTFVLMVMM